MKPNTMKSKLTVALIAAGLLLAWSGVGFADEQMTVIGDAKCAKCLLKEKDTCQNAIVTEDYGKRVTYYLAQNDVSKELHGQVCKQSVKVKAAGTVKEVDGRRELTATKIELVKE